MKNSFSWKLTPPTGVAEILKDDKELSSNDTKSTWGFRFAVKPTYGYDAVTSMLLYLVFISILYIIYPFCNPMTI